jgi:two-component system sensor histidine kinase MtrB
VAERIAEGDLDERIAVHGADEMARLAESFNAMATSLQEQITELEDLSRVQQRFVSDVSHELRTPLTTIRMASDLLYDRSGRVDADTRRSIELLAAQVDRFESLLADLLEISRIDAGAAEVDLEEVDLGDLVTGVIAGSAELAAERRTEMHPVIDAGPPIIADRRRVSRIVRNLLTNALEYGAGSRIEILVAHDAGASAVGVRDRGPGLDEQQQRRVFDRFWRADPSRARTLGGSGLGLSIAREDAVLQHGALEVASSPGDGALFVLTLGQEGLPAPRTRPVPVDLARFDAASSLASQPARTGGGP